MTPFVSSWALLLPLLWSFSLFKIATTVVETRNTIPQKNKKSAAEGTSKTHFIHTTAQFISKKLKHFTEKAISTFQTKVKEVQLS